MNLKKYLDAVNTASARVSDIARQIDAHFEAGETEKALELRTQLDTAKLDYEKANQLYLSMLNATSGGIDPAQQIVQPGAGVQVTKDEGDQPFASDGEFFRAVKIAAQYPGRADPRLNSRKVVDVSGLSEGVPAEGGYLLSPQTSTKWLEAIWSTGEVLRRCARDPIGTGANSITYNGVDETSRIAGSRHGGLLGGWLGEGGTLSGDKPAFRQVEIKLRKDGILIYLTDEQMEDTPNLESFINRVGPDELRFVAEDAIVEGIGGGMPLGILNAAALISVLRTDASKVQFADIVNMWARRYAGVRDYVWLVNQDVVPQLDQLVLASSTDQPTRFIDYLPDGSMRMKGAPVLEVEYCQTMGTVGDIMLCSLSNYQVIEKGDVKAASSIHVAFTTDEMAFRFIYRIGGASLWHSAITPLHGSNTVSPFVALASASS